MLKKYYVLSILSLSKKRGYPVQVSFQEVITDFFIEIREEKRRYGTIRTALQKIMDRVVQRYIRSMEIDLIDPEMLD